MVGILTISLVKGLWRGIGKNAQLIAAMGEAYVIPRLQDWKLKTPLIPPVGLSAIRPWSFKNGVKDKDWRDPKKVLQSKENGVLVEAETDADGKITKMVSARGGKNDFLHAFPHLKDMQLPDGWKEAKFYAEAVHAKGNEYVSGRLHSKPERVADAQKADGPIKLAVLAVHKAGGIHTALQNYEAMRNLCVELAKKLPHATVPEECKGTEQEKRAFAEKIRKANEGKTVQAHDGVVFKKADAPDKGQMIQRLKFPQTGKFVIMGFEDSKKITEAVASLKIGDGEKVMGKVNVADPGMKTTIKLNPDRYMGKVALVEFQRLSSAGKPISPVLKHFLFGEDPDSVPKYDPKSAFNQRLEGMEPDPQKREGLKTALQNAVKKKAAS